jgi:hypothetical protein
MFRLSEVVAEDGFPNPSMGFQFTVVSIVESHLSERVTKAVKTNPIKFACTIAVACVGEL